MTRVLCIPLATIIFPVLVLANSIDISLTLSPKKSQKFVFSNKASAFWYGETANFNGEGYQGYTIAERRYIKDYAVKLDNRRVSRSEANSIKLFPTQLIRDYEKFTEIFHFVDSLNALVVEIQPKQKTKLAVEFFPEEEILKNYFNWNSEQKAITGRFTNFGYNRPTIISGFAIGEEIEVKGYKAPDASAGGALHGALVLEAESARPVYFVMTFTRSLPEMKRVRNAFEKVENVLSMRQKRLERLLQMVSFRSGTPLDNAFIWAVISMDDMVTAQKGVGIWAGLPWFNNYWGRDTFISFTGGLLCTGQLETARQVLQTFAGFQNNNAGSSNYGRIPNRVKLEEIIYNTTDGTPWFIIACDNYLKYSGDSLFMEEMFPVVQRAMEGALQKKVDEDGFLTHADAETWMDAVGSEGPWSPRGNRAVEVQVLWLEQIRISAAWARRLGYDRLADNWEARYVDLRKKIAEKFWDLENHRLFDHLNADGTPDYQTRPNQIFALTLPNRPILNASQSESVLKEVVHELVYPWGTASLAQSDPSFHPYHHYQPYYVPDAAYHNGIVWTWMNGPVLSALFPRNPDLAFQLLQEEARQILEEDAVGSFSELLDAWPREGEKFPRISGTVSQAWSLAEFIRNIHQDLLGFSPSGFGDTLIFSPNLPKQLNHISGKFRLKNSLFSATFRRTNQEMEFELEQLGPEKTEAKTVLFQFISGDDKLLSGKVDWHTGEKLRLRIASGEVWDQLRSTKLKIKKEEYKKLADLQFAAPSLKKDLAVFQGPRHPLIQPEEVTQKPGRLTRILFDIYDPKRDDRGPNGNYQYPTNPAFKEGIFDVQRVKIWRDKDYFYFLLEYTDLVNPGWHPESGYQLTYTAIALNFGHEAGLRRTRVHMNANYNVPFEYAYNYILFVGNGIQLRNSKDEILAEYRPMDANHPIGFVDKKQIRFSIPAKLLPDLKLWNAFVMVGGQDDHGAGGLGEFRKVGVTASEWQGGGADHDSAPNVYDVVGVR